MSSNSTSTTRRGSSARGGSEPKDSRKRKAEADAPLPEAEEDGAGHSSLAPVQTDRGLPGPCGVTTSQTSATSDNQSGVAEADCPPGGVHQAQPSGLAATQKGGAKRLVRVGATSAISQAHTRALSDITPETPGPAFVAMIDHVSPLGSWHNDSGSGVVVTVQVHDAAGTKQSVVFFNDDARVAAEWKVGEVREFKGIAVTARGDADMRFPIYGKFNMKFTSRLVDGATARCIRVVEGVPFPLVPCAFQPASTAAESSKPGQLLDVFGLVEKLDAPRTYPSREDPSKTYYKRELGLADAGGTSTVKLWSEELGACDEAFGKVIGVTAVAVDKGDGTNAGTAKTHAVYKSTTSSQIVMSPPVPVTEEFRLWLKNEFAADLEDVGLAADEPTA